MSHLRTSHMKVRDVINIADGKRLGFMCDAEFDPRSGRLLSICVPGPRLFGIFGSSQDIVIPWEQIVRIGPDVILVDLSSRSGPSEREMEEMMAAMGPPGAVPPAGMIPGPAMPGGNPGHMAGPPGAMAMPPQPGRAAPRPPGGQMPPPMFGGPGAPPPHLGGMQRPSG